MSIQRPVLGLVLLTFAGQVQALPLRIRPRFNLRSAFHSGGAPTSGLVGRPSNALARRRRTMVEQRDATLGGNPARRDADTGLDHPDYIRNQDELVTRAETMARESGDEIVGPAVAYYRTSQGRLVRVTPNKGTGNLRQAARLRSGESLARLEQVGFVTRKGNGLLRVSSEGSGSRIGVLQGGNWAKATGGIIGTTALVFGRDLIRWLGIRNSADAIQDRVVPEEPDPGPEIVIDGQGQIHIDGDGDGTQDIQLQGQGTGVRVQGQDGAAVVVDEGTVTAGKNADGEGEIRIDPGATGPYGVP